MIRFALGTAQFGQQYGVCNRDGMVSAEQAEPLVDFALRNGIVTFDTAAIYGDSESILGRVLPPQSGRVITKLQLGDDVQHPADIAGAVRQSLKRLGREYVDGILIHNAEEMIMARKSRILSEILKEIKQQGLASRTGISVYTPQALIEMPDDGTIDIVQFSSNPLDQRFLAPDVQSLLKEKNIEVYARSLFLQGVLLQNDYRSLPSFFHRYADVFRAIEILCHKHDMSRLDFCLAYAHWVSKGYKIDYWVVGVDTVEQLSDIVESAARAEADDTNMQISFRDCACDPVEALIDPRKWKDAA